MVGKINHYLQVGTKASLVTFYIVCRLVDAFILGCDFHLRHVKTIHRRIKRVKLVDGTTVQVAWKPVAQS